MEAATRLDDTRMLTCEHCRRPAQKLFPPSFSLIEDLGEFFGPDSRICADCFKRYAGYLPPSINWLDWLGLGALACVVMWGWRALRN